MNSKKLTGWFLRWYKPVFSVVAIIGVSFFLYGWKLGSLPPNLSSEERAAALESSTIKLIVENPVNAPHKIPQYVVQKSIDKSPQALRSVSVMFGVLAAFCFYMVLRWWFKFEAAVLGAILFSTSPWLIINARSATVAIMYLSTLFVIAAYLWLQSTQKHHNTALIVAFIAGALSLYVPGVFIITLIGVLAVKDPLHKAYKSASTFVRYSLPVLTTLLLTPLVYAIAMEPKILKQLLLLPDSWLAPIKALEAVAWTGLGIVWRTRDNLPTTIGTLPVLDALCVVLFIVGTFWMLTQVKRRRTYWLFISLGISLVIIGLSQQALELLLVLPAIYIVVAGGLNFLYTEWFRVFPRNPLAKWVGISVVLIAVMISVVYSVRYALVAWPLAPETTEYYMLQ